MLDPATFRRLRPNYQFSHIKPTDPDILSDSSASNSSSECEESDESDNSRSQSDPRREPSRKQIQKKKQEIKKRWKKKVVQDSDDPDQVYTVKVNVPDPAQEPEKINDFDQINKDGEPDFGDEDYLIASPVVLGFSFGKKMWLEFSVAGISDIQWNEGAFDSLIIPDDRKTVVKAQVESHGWEATRNIDDVIRGKGRGLVAVLHGPTGTGKTLTAEGIAELLKKPLYVRPNPPLPHHPPTAPLGGENGRELMIVPRKGGLSRRARHQHLLSRAQIDRNPRRGAHLGRPPPPRRSRRLPRSTH